MNDCYIYVEEDAWNYPRTARILEKLDRDGNAGVVDIHSYRDLFGRKRQSYRAQHAAGSVILAVKREGYLYPGAPVCQDFGNAHFYYSTCIMNCIFDCEYCFLKGMYPSGYPVIFVNLEDYFAAAEEVLREHPVYLCVSYETDLPAFEGITGYAGEWADFAAGRGSRLSIEIRTKSASPSLWEGQKPSGNVIWAFTLSPQKIVESFEHGTPSLSARLRCVREGLERGFPIRLCFDPMIYCPGWKEACGQMLDEVIQSMDLRKLRDVSVGSFRISGEYLKNIRRMEPDSPVIWYPFARSNGYCHYDQELMDEMEGFLTRRLEPLVGREKIFRW